MNLDRTDEIQLQRVDASRYVQTILSRDRNRLESYRVIESSYQDMGAGSDAKGRTCGRACVMACQNTGARFCGWSEYRPQYYPDRRYPMSTPNFEIVPL